MIRYFYYNVHLDKFLSVRVIAFYFDCSMSLFAMQGLMKGKLGLSWKISLIGWKRRKVGVWKYAFLLLVYHIVCMYLLPVHKPLLRCFLLANHESVMGWKAGSLVVYSKTCLWEKMTNKWVLKKMTTETTWTSNCDVPFRISSVVE